jgi:hypothetical protein
MTGLDITGLDWTGLGGAGLDLDHGKSPGLGETNAGYVLPCRERNETGREKMER